MTSSNYYDADITVQSMCNNMVVNGTITQKDQEHTLHTYRHVFGESAIWKGWITANDLKNLLHCSFFYLYQEERSHVSDLASSLKNYQSIQSIIDPSRISQFIRRIWGSDVQLCLRRVSQTWTGGSCANLHGSQSHGNLERDVPQCEHDTSAFPTFALNWAHMDQG